MQETISKHMSGKKVSSSSHHGFTNGKACLTNLTNFCDGDSSFYAFIGRDASQNTEKLKVGKHSLNLHQSVFGLTAYVWPE